MTLGGIGIPRQGAARIALLVIALVVWEGLSRAAIIDSNTLPSVTSIVAAGGHMLMQAYFWDDFRLTIAETALGFIVGTLAGVTIALVVSVSRVMRRALWPWVTFLANLPAVAMAPIFVGILGFGLWSRVATAALICFFPVAINSLAGMEDRDRDSEAMFTLLGASRRQKLVEFLVPTAAPGFFAGLKIGVSLAFIGAVVAEFVAGEGGLGVLVQDLTFQYQLGAVFFVVGVISLIGLMMYEVFSVLERRVIFWTAPETK